MVQPYPDIQGKIILITGSTDGLGKYVAADLAKQGATILLHGRNLEKGKSVVEEIKNETGNENIFYYNADLSSLEQVRGLAEKVKTENSRLDILINNAGIGDGADKFKREESEDGYELRFAVNHLSHFLLTLLLEPLLIQSAHSRIIHVSSIGQQAIDFNNLMLKDNYDGLRAYMQSKLAQVMFTFEHAEKLSGTGVTVNCLHPSTLMNTNMVYESASFPSTMSRIEDGADAVEYLAASPDLNDVTGEYFNKKQKAKADPQAYDKEARRKLWEVSEALAGIQYPVSD